MKMISAEQGASLIGVALVIGLGALIAASSNALAHGEDKPGPHKGDIRMPGAFHTELVWTGARQVRVYLLDMEYKNPTTERSSVSVTVNPKDGAGVKADCRAEKTSFLCNWSGGPTKKNFASLLLEADRAGLKSVAPATYTIDDLKKLTKRKKTGRKHDHHDHHH